MYVAILSQCIATCVGRVEALPVDSNTKNLELATAILLLLVDMHDVYCSVSLL